MSNLTDPFEQRTPSVAPAIEAPQSQFDATEETISRGMPKKNFKVFALCLIGLALAGVIFWPQQKTEPTKQDVAPEPTNKTVAAGIVDSLSQGQGTGSQPVVEQNGSPKSAFQLPARKGFQPLVDETQNGELSPAEKAEMEFKTRQESINSSSMIPGDFSLDTKKTSDPAGNRMPQPPQSMTEMLQAQEKMFASLASQQGNQQQTQSGQQPRRDPNLDFLQTAGSQTVGQLDQTIVAPPKYSLFQGTMVRGVLLNGINTEVPGEFRARVVSDVFDSSTQRSLIIPRGSILIGAYKSSILVGQSRMVLAAQRLIMPNGRSINLRGSVLNDRSGVGGMPGEVDNHFWEMFKASAIVGAASLLLPKDQRTITTTTGFGGQQTSGTVIAKALSDVVTRIAERNSSIGPTGSVDAGEVFTLMIQRDIAMEPYKW